MLISVFEVGKAAFLLEVRGVISRAALCDSFHCGHTERASSGWGSGTHEAAVVSASAKSSPNRPNVQGNRGTWWHPLVYRHRDRLCQRWELHLCFPSASQDVILESPSSEYGRTPKMLKSYSVLWCTQLPIVQCITHQRLSLVLAFHLSWSPYLTASPAYEIATTPVHFLFHYKINTVVITLIS